jgi:hypothetical protein
LGVIGLCGPDTLLMKHKQIIRSREELME